jgi:hypothetical protein
MPQETWLAFGSDEILAQSNAKQVGGEEVPFAQTLSHLPPALQPDVCRIPGCARLHARKQKPTLNLALCRAFTFRASHETRVRWPHRPIPERRRRGMELDDPLVRSTG